jgi:hypothetical protein
MGRGNNAGMGDYTGTDVSTGSQTPEGVTTPTTDVFDSGMAGGTGGRDNENA